MNRQLALLVLATVTLTACAFSPKQQNGKHAPIVELESGPSAAIAKAEPAAESKVEQPKAESGSVAVAPAQAGSGGYLAGDGPGADAPANLDDIPDAVPKAEPLHRYANREYTALGKTYKPLTVTGAYKETGIASWYGKKFHGQRTSIGETYDMYGMTAAHPTLPIPSYARVTNVATKKSVIVRVNDRGPFLHDRIIDLSYTAAYKLRIINNGSAEVEVESIAVDDSAPLTVSTVLSSPQVKSEPLPAEPVVPAVVAAAPVPAVVAAEPGKVYLQPGAFKSPQGAESFLLKMRGKLGDADKSLVLIQKDGLERVQLGPYASKEEARKTSEALKTRLGFKPYVSTR